VLVDVRSRHGSPELDDFALDRRDQASTVNIFNSEPT